MELFSKVHIRTYVIRYDDFLRAPTHILIFNAKGASINEFGAFVRFVSILLLSDLTTLWTVDNDIIF